MFISFDGYYYYNYKRDLTPNDILNMISTKLVDPTLSTENNKILIIGISGLKEFHEFKRFLSFNQLIERGIYNISEKLIC